VVFANPQGNQTSRVPLKAGAEIFGAAGIGADAEVIGLMLEALEAAGMHAPVLLLGHMGIYRGLVARLIEEGGLDEANQGQLFSCIQRKGASDIRALLDDSHTAEMLSALPGLMGDMDILPVATDLLQRAPQTVLAALDELRTLAELVRNNHPQVGLRIDVSELSGYGYHNGPVFAVYHPQHGSALAQGGRYDGVGEVFGRGRPATGFDMNLKQLMTNSVASPSGYFVPYSAPELRDGLASAVQALRAEGHRVVVAVTETESMPLGCEGILVQDHGTWTPRAVGETVSEQ
jgi:ATP phosphoribosyltransferase regulatory subunit